jgi:hypothetical protein
MGTYCYKITRAKKRKIGGFDIHTPEFVFKSGGSWYDDIDSKGRTRDERLFDKYCKPTVKSWDRRGGANGTLFVWDYEDGSPIYSAKTAVWYDGVDNGEIVGYLRSDGHKFRIDVNLSRAVA